MYNSTTMYRLTFFVACLSLAASEGCATRAETHLTRAQWSVATTRHQRDDSEVVGLELRVETTTTAATFARQFVRLHLFNQSAEVQPVWLTAVDWDFHFEVVGPTAGAGKPTEYEQSIQSGHELPEASGRSVDLPPRSEVVFDVDLTQLFDLSVPGEYLVIAQFRPLDPDNPTRVITAKSARFQRVN
jgi:hypothetical protein